MSVYRLPDIPLTIIGHTVTLYRDGLPHITGKLTKLKIEAQYEEYWAFLSFDGMTDTFFTTADDKTDYKLEVKD